MERRRLNDLQYIERLFHNSTRVSGTVFKLDVENGFTNYSKKIGNPMDENTLIVGDNDNNVFIVFKKNKTLVPDLHTGVRVIFDGVNIIHHLKYGSECILHKKQEPIDVPKHIVNIVMQNNVYQTNNFADSITTNFNNINLNSDKHVRTTHDEHNTDFDAFMNRFYKEGGMVPIKNLKQHAEWNNEYETHLITKKIHMCKSCKRKAHKGCCSEYSSSNRVMIKMVIGWHSNTECHSSSKRENNE